MSAEQCDAQFAGYDGMFGVYCERPQGHDGLHKDGTVRWWDLRDGPLPSESDAAAPESF